ncbi:MAG: AmmeMemoRadiSam system radical SAM enzyme [Treponema sp.]|nr:AmmeMemoRadiSam system radical SAM enzyme [Treponema sp.]
MEQPARFLDGNTPGILHCKLCPRLCVIPDGNFGACRVRGNKNGKGILPFSGCVTALAADPIEKKPLYHFRPGSKILSVGFAGCNLNCPFCQNWHISQSVDAPQKKMRPDDLISAALNTASRAIAYTYSEPLVHIEFLLDCMTLAHKHGIANVLVTNGCINSEAAGEILLLTDAANIDLKCFSHDNYANILGGNLDTVLAFIRLAAAQNVHVEITTLIVPGFNDSVKELDLCADFIRSSPAASEIPWHLSAYHPDYRWNAPPADPELLLALKKQAAEKLLYVYAGNIPDEENNTTCPGCGEIIVRRIGYCTDSWLSLPKAGEQSYRCAKCGGKTAIRR